MVFLRRLALPMLVCTGLFAQTPARLEFEVASIKPTGQLTSGMPGNVGLHIDGAQVRCNWLSLKDYVAIAYRLKHHQVAGPDWIGGERYDIAAKLPEGAVRDQVPEMLQSLLAERFQLKAHRESRDLPVYALVLGKSGVKVAESPLDPPEEGADPSKAPVNVSASGGRAGVTINYGRGAYFTFANNKLIGKKLSMAAMAETLARFMDRPVVDATGQSGTYDFEMEFTPEDYRAMMVRSAIAAGVVLPPEAMRLLDASGDSLFTAVQTLGLRLDSRKAPAEVLVIDNVLRTPTAN